jgi:hypothetical protein
MLYSISFLSRLAWTCAGGRDPNEVLAGRGQLAFPQAQVRLDAAGFDQISKFSVDELGNLCFDLFVDKKQINHNSIPGNRLTGQPGSLPYTR